jgi:choline dehydrogenase-like flavoprotein
MSVNQPDPSSYDVAVIGSGVAGALLARELAHAGFRVCVLEAGGAVERGQAVQRYRESMVRDLAAPYPRWPWAPIPDAGNAETYFGKESAPEYRPSYLKLIGGTTWHWTGMTPRFLPADFELRSRYGVGMDWPVGYAELESYYLKAEHALGVAGDSVDDHGSPRSGAYPMPPIPMPYSDRVVAERLAKHGVPVKPFPAARNSRPYHDRPQCCGNNTCTPICPIGAQYSADTDVQKAIRAGARLIDQATVYRFELNSEKHIVAAHYKLPDGSSHRIAAKRFVVACNSIETPRLLLMSACEQAPDGIANSSGQVGRNLMDHLIFFNNFRMDTPIYGGRGPQSVSGVMTGRDGTFRRRHSAVKLFLSNDLNVQEKALQAIDNQQQWSDVVGVMKQAAIRQGCIGGELEPLPSERNRILLDRGRLDQLGLPLPRVEYRIDDYVNDGLVVWKKFVGDLIGKMGAASLSFAVAHSSHHPSGTARMGNNPVTSVVDRNCRSHGHPNLYVVGGSVFPTMGTANPTLTIAALSLRLAEHLAIVARSDTTPHF